MKHFSMLHRLLLELPIFRITGKKWIIKNMEFTKDMDIWIEGQSVTFIRCRFKNCRVCMAGVKDISIEFCEFDGENINLTLITDKNTSFKYNVVRAKNVAFKFFPNRCKKGENIVLGNDIQGDFVSIEETFTNHITDLLIKNNIKAKQVNLCEMIQKKSTSVKEPLVESSVPKYYKFSGCTFIGHHVLSFPPDTHVTFLNCQFEKLYRTLEDCFFEVRSDFVHVINQNEIRSKRMSSFVYLKAPTILIEENLSFFHTLKLQGNIVMFQNVSGTLVRLDTNSINLEIKNTNLQMDDCVLKSSNCLCEKTNIISKNVHLHFINIPDLMASFIVSKGNGIFYQVENGNWVNLGFKIDKNTFTMEKVSKTRLLNMLFALQKKIFVQKEEEKQKRIQEIENKMNQCSVKVLLHNKEDLHFPKTTV